MTDEELREMIDEADRDGAAKSTRTSCASCARRRANQISRRLVVSVRLSTHAKITSTCTGATSAQWRGTQLTTAHRKKTLYWVAG